MEKVKQNSCLYERGIDYLQVPDIVDDIDEDTSISESPTVITGVAYGHFIFLKNLFPTICYSCWKEGCCYQWKKKEKEDSQLYISRIKYISGTIWSSW